MATIVAANGDNFGDYSPRERRQFVSYFGDHSRQCGRGL